MEYRKNGITFNFRTLNFANAASAIDIRAIREVALSSVVNCEHWADSTVSLQLRSAAYVYEGTSIDVSS